MKNSSHTISVGYNLDKWNGYGIKEPVLVDIAPNTNSSIIMAGMSGSGKSYAENLIFAKLVVNFPDAECYFADYKQEPAFEYLRDCPRYFPYKKAIEALDIVYDKLQKRQAGEDKSLHPITLIFDEYIACMLSLINEDKKKATQTMNKVSDILMIGRSLSVRLFITCQRPDAIAFPVGSRLNFGIIIILGGSATSIYEMLIPEHVDKVKDKLYERGEGVLLLQGVELHSIKIPTVQNVERMQAICIKALS